MQRITADTLTFTLPTAWGDVTTAQALTLPTVIGTRDTFLLLSGLTVEQLRPLRAPDLDALVAQHLAFLNTPPTFGVIMSPVPLQIGERTITPPKTLGSETTIAQKWDVDDALKAITPPADGDEPPTVSLIDAARPLLSIYLAPTVNNRPYTGDSDAHDCWSLIQHLPCMNLLPLAAFFLSRHYRPMPSGRLSSRPIPPSTSRIRPWLSRLWRALTCFRRTRPSAS